MRQLTIRRAKCYVACLSTTIIYIEDASQCELTICGIPCRKLGAIKNGEEGVFTIPNERVRIFAIVGKLSRSYCNDMFVIPEGNEDVILEGQHKFSLISGHAFRFNNNTDPEALENRKKAATIGWVVVSVSLAVGTISGFALGYWFGCLLFA